MIHARNPKTLLQKYHPELGEDLKVDALTPRLLPEMTVKPHDAKDSARCGGGICFTTDLFKS